MRANNTARANIGGVVSNYDILRGSGGISGKPKEGFWFVGYREFEDNTQQSFTSLSDTPADYTGQAGKLLQVSNSEDSIVFTDKYVKSLNKADGGKVGINALANNQQRLTVKSDKVSFKTETGDFELKLKKNATPNIAELSYYTGNTAHARIGLVNNDNFGALVSVDGASWLRAFELDNQTGVIKTDGPTHVITVGADKQFQTIQDAVAYASKLVVAPYRWIEIIVDPGVYNVGSRLNLENLTKVHIRSTNPSNPSATRITFTGDSNGQAHGVVFLNCNRVLFSGFTIDGTGVTLMQGLYITEQSVVWTERNSLIIQNCHRGLVVEQQSRYVGWGVRIYMNYANNNGNAVVVSDNSFCNIQHINIRGNGNTSGNTYSGIYVTFGSYVWAAYANIRDVYVGILSQFNSCVYATNSTFSNAYYAFIVNRNSYGAFVYSNVTNVWRGLSAYWGVVVDCRYTTFDNVSNIAVYADTKSYVAAHSATVRNAQYGFVAWCMSTIDAYNTRSLMSNVNVQYSPSQFAQLGNHNAQIRMT